MVIVLPKVESSGEQFGRAITSGIEKGLSRSMDFKQQIALERARRGLDVESQLGALSPETRGLITGKGQQGMPSRGVPSQGMPSQGMQYGEISPEDKDYGTTNVARSPGYNQKVLNPAEKEYEIARRVNEARQLGYQPNLEAIKNKIEEEQNNLLKQREEEKNVRTLTDEVLTKQYGTEDKGKWPSFKEQNFLYNKAVAYRNHNFSDQQIKSKLFEDITSFNNAKAAINALPKYENILRKAGRDYSETSLRKEELANTIKATIKPLLDEGLHDEVRNLLAKRGYNREDIESYMYNLGDVAKQELANLPKISKNISKMKGFQKSLSKLNPLDAALSMVIKKSEPTKANLLPKFEESIKSILSQDPSTNLLLLRREMMDRGMSWQDYANTINNLVLSNEYKMPVSQQTRLRDLKEPPLDFLDNILYTIGMKGR